MKEVQMKKFFILPFALGLILTLSGCGEQQFKGKYISVPVEYQPIDEFEHEGWVVLSFETPGKRQEEGRLYSFWIYRNAKKMRELTLEVRIVGTRKFYLQEQVGENTVSHASFVAPPTYEAIKERIKALLSSGK
jgi:hypothetical protein